MLDTHETWSLTNYLPKFVVNPLVLLVWLLVVKSTCFCTSQHHQGTGEVPSCYSPPWSCSHCIPSLLRWLLYRNCFIFSSSDSSASTLSIPSWNQTWQLQIHHKWRIHGVFFVWEQTSSIIQLLNRWHRTPDTHVFFFHLLLKNHVFFSKVDPDSGSSKSIYIRLAHGISPENPSFPHLVFHLIHTAVAWGRAWP